MHRISTWNRSTNFEGEGFLDYRASSHVASRIRAKEIRGKDRLDLDLPPRGREINGKFRFSFPFDTLLILNN